MQDSPSTPSAAVPHADAVLEALAQDHASGAICAVLTPAIKSALRELSPGAVLAVRVDDPEAREDVASWCRLSGNELVAAVEEPTGVLSLYVRKKSA